MAINLYLGYTANDINLYLGSWEKVLNKMQPVDVILTSAPYNIGSRSPAITGRRKFGGFDPKSFRSITDYPDNLSEKEYQEQQKKFVTWAISKIKKSGAVIYNHKNRQKDGNLVSPRDWLKILQDKGILEIREEIIWDRGSTHNHAKTYLYPQNEIIYILTHPQQKKQDVYFKNEDFYWKEKRNKGCGTVWRIPPDSNGKGHNAPFPLKLARHCIRLYTPNNGIVCDPYSGSGTTMIAAYLENRKFIGSEILKKYYDLSIKRFEECANHEYS